MPQRLPNPLVGTRFHRLRVALPNCKKKNQRRWFAYCLCDCGAYVTVSYESLRSGHTQSCGCLRRERAADVKTKHGCCTGDKKYLSYFCTNAKQRCTNPNNKCFYRYGGRGIKYLLSGPAEVLEDIGERPSPLHSVDRIDNDGHYERGNIRWALPKTQTRNTRQNRMITHNGKTQCATDWAAEVGIPAQSLLNRIYKGWTPERAITTPLRAQSNNKAKSTCA